MASHTVGFARAQDQAAGAPDTDRHATRPRPRLPGCDDGLVPSGQTENHGATRAPATSALVFGVPVVDPLDDMLQASQNVSTRTESTRRELANTRRQTTRKRYLAATAIVAVAGSLVGTGFIVQSNSASAERAAATAQLYYA